ncbi:hypothetical protein [Spiroplasma endosymbiont of Virgichneumon dumeticola]|uniref:hypothetical protein n=1 Tax=Spiroplasma endosymbiont of Virgichneumon dumeticola TaxID=3139323 RepID=UPI0035C92844
MNSFNFIVSSTSTCGEKSVFKLITAPDIHPTGTVPSRTNNVFGLVATSKSLGLNRGILSLITPFVSSGLTLKE